MCNVPLSQAHQHLLEPVNRKLTCACEACAILFTGGSEARYRRVPRRVSYLSDFRLTDTKWDRLMMPINMAFFFRNTPQGRIVALYPSPAGATESLLPLDAWDEIEADNPVLREMEPDVEALLVNRIGSSRGFSRAEYFLAPIDECYRLVGVIRSRWQGLSGGTEVWREIGLFFNEMKARAPELAEISHA
jgi:hypothetical protein